MRKSLFLLPLVIVALNFPSSADYDPLVRIDPALDLFLYRMQARYSLAPRSINVQPLHSADLLIMLDSLQQTPALSERERYLCQKLTNRTGPFGGLYHYNDDVKKVNLKVNLNLLGDLSTRSHGEVVGGRGILSPLFSGNIGNFSFYSALDVWTQYRSDTLFSQSSYQPYDGVPYNLYDRGRENNHLCSSDLPRGGISYDAGRIVLETAIDYLKFGPTVYYPLTLSGQTPPITYFRASLDLSVLEYQHIVGLLRSQKDRPKYLYAHRLSGSLFKERLFFGINEVIVGGSTTDQQGPDDPYNSLRPHYYGEQRDWEWTYFIPFVPFKFVEHYIGDRDNAALSFDGSILWPQNFRFYGEFFLDDFLSPWKMFTDDFGNKWALTAGMQYFGTLWSRDLNAGIEYHRIEPWVYTHFYGGSHRYDHFNQPLGSPLGPNSQAIVASCDIGVNKKLSAGVKITSLALNDSTRGSKITDVFQDDIALNPDLQTKKFLGPGTDYYFRPGIYASYDPFGIFKLNALFELDLAKDKGQVRLQMDGGFCF